MKKAVVVFGIVLMMTTLSACQKGNSAGNRTGNRNAANANVPAATTSTDVSAATTSTDVSVVQEFFPGLEGIESTEFEVIKHGGDDPRSIPGPTDYIYQGYIVLTEDTANTIAEKYEWQDFETDVTFESITERDGDYKLDGHFTKEILKGTLSGRVWFNEADRTILFNVQTL